MHAYMHNWNTCFPSILITQCLLHYRNDLIEKKRRAWAWGETMKVVCNGKFLHWRVVKYSSQHILSRKANVLIKCRGR